jgi:hypothetical protein
VKEQSSYANLFSVCIIYCNSDCIDCIQEKKIFSFQFGHEKFRLGAAHLRGFSTGMLCSKLSSMTSFYHASGLYIFIHNHAGTGVKCTNTTVISSLET